MSTTPDMEKSTEFDDKDDRSSRSLPDDEENVLQSGDKRDVDKFASKDEEEKGPQPEAKDADEIPNGGLKAWLQVLGSFMLFFNTFGILK